MPSAIELGRLARRAFSTPLIPLLGALFALGGCSFILDFPREGATKNAGGAGGSGGNGGSGGAGVPSCLGTGKGPVADDVTWRAIPKVVSYNSFVSSTGLVYSPGQQALLIYGTSSDGLQTFNLPTGNANQIFVVGRFDTGIVNLLLAGHACTYPWSNRAPITRHMAGDPMFPSIYGAGSLPTDETATGTWSFAFNESDGCGTSATETPYATIGGDKAGAVPLAIDMRGGMPPASTFNFSEGTTLDVAVDGFADTRLWIGGARGTVKGTSIASTSVFIRMLQSVAEKVVVLQDLFIDTRAPLRAWPGAIALDKTNLGWFGGSSCAAPGGCDDAELYLGTFDTTDGTATVLEKRGGGKSAIMSIRYADDRVVVGGQYEGMASLRGVMLPEADTTTPFVQAIDAATKQPVWTWPASDGPSGADPAAYRGVVDIAVLGQKTCGAVYVLGCSSPLTVGYRDCSTIEPGKTSFLTKLDLATGTVIWSNTVKLTTYQDIFMPTAIASAPDHVWVAATYAGKLDPWGQHVESGMSRESLVLHLKP